MADMLEGKYEPALENYEQALKLVGDNPAPYFLGKIYANMAGSCWFLKRPQEGIRNLEKSISYYERTEHKANATDGYNNLGINLILVGDWKRAQTALDKSLALASEVHHDSPKLSMPLDSLGELRLLRGDLTAQSYLERAVASPRARAQVVCGTGPAHMGRCRLAMTDATRAREHAAGAYLRRSDCWSPGYLRIAPPFAEANLMCGDLEECSVELEKVAEQTTTPSPTGFAGEAQRLHGLLAMAKRPDSGRAAFQPQRHDLRYSRRPLQGRARA